MKIKSFLVAALAVVTLASCSKDNDGGKTNGDDAVVRLQLNFTGAESRATGAPIADGKALEVNNGWLLFANNNNQLERAVKILPSGSSETPDNKTSVALAALTGNGAYLTEIPGYATKLHFVANLPVDVKIPPVGEYLTPILDRTLTLKEQWDGGGVSNVALYGEGSVVKVSGQSTHSAEASVNVYAIAAHMQIKKLTIDPASDNSLDSFEVDGIFINYYNENSTVKGVTSNFVSHTGYAQWHDQGTDYPSALNGVIFDYNDVSGVGTFATPDYTPKNITHVWAYNLFPEQTPHIVVKFKEVMVDDGHGGTELMDKTGIKYLTVSGFAESMAIEKGKIYTVNSIPVHEKNLTDYPEVGEALIVKAEVNLIPWEEITLTPDQF